MEKYLKLTSILLLFSIFFSCRKESSNEWKRPSDRFIYLTQHKWAMTHEYVDSTVYAKNNLHLWPFSTTDDWMDTDPCTLESLSLFLSNGDCQLIKGPSCNSSMATDVGDWVLSNNDSDFSFVGQGTFHIVELTPSDFKMWYPIETYVGGQLVLTEYCMWTFEAR